MSINSFRTRKFEDFEILDSDNSTIGHIRVKPSGVAWAPKGAKEWYGVSLAVFSSFMEEHGRKKKK